LAPANEDVELGWNPHIATAAVRAAHERNGGGEATRAAESVVCGKKDPGDCFPKGRAAAFELLRDVVRQRSFPREPTIDLGEIRQCAYGGSLHRQERAALASGSSRRSSADTASKIVSASGASRIVFTTSSSENICVSLWSQGR
jgi:hypothetical protein